MTESRYAIPLEDLVAAARVPDEDQVQVRAEPAQPGSGWSVDPLPHGDGMGSDADGD